MFGYSWCVTGVLGSQVFGQASMESCDLFLPTAQASLGKGGEYRLLMYIGICKNNITACKTKQKSQLNKEDKLQFTFP